MVDAAAEARREMKRSELEFILQGIMPPIREYIDEQIAAHTKAMRYRGIFQHAEHYQRNNCVTYDGCLFIATRDDPGQPGKPDSGWQLAVKRGRDGADAR